MLQRTDTEIEAVKNEIGFYSTEDVSRMTGISAETIRCLCMTGELKARKAGKSWIITKVALINYFSCAE